MADAESAHPDPAGDILEMKFEDGQVGVAAAGEGVASADGRHDRGRPSGFQGLDAHQMGIVEILPWVMGQQVPHQEQPQCRQSGGRARSDASHLPKRCRR